MKLIKFCQANSGPALSDTLCNTNMMSIIDYLHPNYWLSLHIPHVSSGAGRLLFVFFSLMVIVGVVVRVMSANRKKTHRRMSVLLSRVSVLLLTMGIIGAVLYFFSYEEARFLGSRFWYPVWILSTLIWTGLITYYTKKKVPGMLIEEKERLEREKYLPGRKKKK